MVECYAPVKKFNNFLFVPTAQTLHKFTNNKANSMNFCIIWTGNKTYFFRHSRMWQNFNSDAAQQIYFQEFTD